MDQATPPRMTTFPRTGAEYVPFALNWWTVALSTIMILSLIANSVVGLRSGVSKESGILPGELPYLLLFVSAALALAPLVLAALAGQGAGFGTPLPRRPRWPRFLTAVALTWLAMGVTGIANPWVRYFLGHEQWSGISSTRPVTDPEMAFLAVFAGVTEEATQLAIPSGLAYLGLSFVNVRRVRSGRGPMTEQRLWAIAVAIGPGLVLFARGAGHLYQGTVSAVLALVWGAALAGVFLWARSVWPVMLGHAIYNLPVHHDSFAPAVVHYIIVPAALAAAGAAVVRSCRPSQGPYTS